MEFYAPRARSPRRHCAHTALSANAMRWVFHPPGIGALAHVYVCMHARARPAAFVISLGREKKSSASGAKYRLANSNISRIAVKRVIGTNGLRMTMMHAGCIVSAVVAPRDGRYNCLSR